MTLIHSTACVDASARIAADVTIGPFCVIGPDVALGSGCELSAHVFVTGHTTIGERTRIYPFASLGTPPQSVHYRGSATRLMIGSSCTIREGVTVNTGTEDGGGMTQVGDRCFMMVGSHVGHDCRIGDDVTFANNAVVGGHAVIGNGVVLGGQAAIHQHVRIGEGAMVAGVSGVAADIIPFGFAIGQRAALDGLNVVGMRRKGLQKADVQRARRAYQVLFLGSGTLQERIARAEQEFTGDSLVERILAFVRTRTARPLMMAQATAAQGE